MKKMVIFDLGLCNTTEDKKEREQKIINLENFIPLSIFSAGEENEQDIPFVNLLYDLNVKNSFRLLKFIINEPECFMYELESDIFKICRTKGAAEELYDYVKQNIDYLKPFFVTVREKCPVNIIVEKVSINLDVDSIAMLKNDICSLNDRDLLVLLLRYMHLHNDMPLGLINYALKSKENFAMYLQGAAYPYKIKSSLWDIYTKCNIDGNGIDILGEKLYDFIHKYYQFYIESCTRAVGEAVNRVAKY